MVNYTKPKPTTAILVHINFGLPYDEERRAEFKELVRSAGAECADLILGQRSAPAAKYFVGSGKAEEIKKAVAMHESDVVIFNHDLTPAQERNLEKLIACRVLDRTGLILDIFAQRARTHEGKLQVELAQLKHLSTRLVRGWTHLERQKGGIGLRGPGETQLETDRRLLGNRIKTINKRLDKVEQQRKLSRRSREKAIIPTVSLVGYTNAGKSTLFNRLANENLYAENQLFATLDPTLRNILIAHFGPIILVDTVGFIRELPHDLIAAFKSTLEETRQADLLLHIIDSGNPQASDVVFEVEKVLTEIGADHVPQLQVYNKIDLRQEATPRIDRDPEGFPKRVWVSALTGEGMDLLAEAVGECLAKEMIETNVVLSAERAELRAQLYSQGLILKEELDDSGNWRMKLRLPKRVFKAWQHFFKPKTN